ncbi:MAG TPA: diacylglycerol kinase family protein [Candidatus Acidoferrales bacterium]|nr:diacylglycerol kinase family protein [Candidatus Acidoferrales bacterium]
MSATRMEEPETSDAAPGRRHLSNAALIFNPAAGGGRLRRQFHHLEEAQAILARSGIDTTLLVTGEPGDATEFARQSVADGYDMVIASGGDGTNNEVVNGLAGSNVPLAVLPSGTANILAKELGIPWDVRRAAELIPRSRPRRIALGSMEPLSAEPGHSGNGNGRRYFLCVGGAGADGALVYSLDLGTKLKAGILAYWMEGARQLLRYRFPAFHITSQECSVDATLVVVGRTKHYGGPFQITTGASLFDDEFEVVAATSRNPFIFLSYLPALWLGSLRRRGDIHVWKTDTLRCELPGEVVHTQVDGEPAGRLGVAFCIVPSALTLMVPETAGPRN